MRLSFPPASAIASRALATPPRPALENVNINLIIQDAGFGTVMAPGSPEMSETPCVVNCRQLVTLAGTPGAQRDARNAIIPDGDADSRRAHRRHRSAATRDPWRTTRRWKRGGTSCPDLSTPTLTVFAGTRAANSSSTGAPPAERRLKRRMPTAHPRAHRPNRRGRRRHQNRSCAAAPPPSSKSGYGLARRRTAHPQDHPLARRRRRATSRPFSRTKSR